MRIAVIGAGAIGGYYGGLLSQVEDVTFLVRRATLDVLRGRGLELREGDGNRVITVKATDSAFDVGPVDVVIVTTKARDLHAALDAARPLIGPTTLVMPVQNGVEAPYLTAEHVGEQAVVPCIVRGFLEHVAPGIVAYHGGPRSFTFNNWNNRPTPAINAMAEAIRRAGFEAVIPDDVWVDLWEKAMFVVPLGALGALADQPLGVLCGPLRAQLTAVVTEIHDVAVARGVPLDAHSIARTLAFSDGLPAESTSSMQRDILQGKPSELDAQVGGIIRQARMVGVATPLLDLMQDVLSLRPGQAV
jgi:2-dehydropantoate 2-reductase